MPVREFVMGNITKRINDNQTEAKKLAKAKRILDRLSPDQLFTYHITLNSLWEKEGEKNFELTKQGNLEDLILEAEVEFKKLNNNRSDVQASYWVFVYITKDVCVRLPESQFSMFREYNRKRKL